MASSKGWQLCVETMERELLAAAMHIAENPEMSSKEVDFRRGSIWAAKQLLELPKRLQARLETEIVMTRDDEKRPPALK